MALPVTRRKMIASSAAVALGLASARAKAQAASPLAGLHRYAHGFQRFVVGHLMDDDGLCRSALCAATLAPWTNQDLDEMAQAIFIDMFQNSPDKAGCLSYENALMATGEFALSQTIRYRVTSQPVARDLAERAIRGILDVVEQGRYYMPGWLPKPFRGLGRARDSHETSPDQYVKALVALHAWRPFASATDQAVIDRFFIDAADFFIATKFRLAYRQRTIITPETHHHALGLFVPLLILAANAASDDGYLEYHDKLSGAIDAAFDDELLANFNMTSLIAEGYDVAIQEGHSDPRLPRMIQTLWQRGSARIDANGDAYDVGTHTKDPESTRLAAIATLVDSLDPTTLAVELAPKILARNSDARSMIHTRLPGSISQASVTSWLVAYWRLREWTASSEG